MGRTRRTGGSEEAALKLEQDYDQVVAAPIDGVIMSMIDRISSRIPLWIRRIIKNILGRTLYPVLMPGAIRRLRKASANSIEEWIDLSMSFKYGLPVKGLHIQFKPGQVRSEILGLLNILEPERPNVVCEIGTAGGGTLFLLSRISDSNATLISIDMPWGKFGSGYLPAQIPLFQSFARDDQKVHLLREDSHAQLTVDKLAGILSGKKIDYLLIDGDHTYEGVKQDFNTYSPFVRDGGLIAFHDIVPGPKDKVGGVHVFWKEMRSSYEHQEFVQD